MRTPAPKPRGSSEPDAGAANRSQEKTPNNRKVQAELLDRKPVVHRKLNHLIDKAQSKHVSDSGDRVEKTDSISTQVACRNDSSIEFSTITAKQPSMRAQRSQNDLPVARAPALSNSNLMSDAGDALSAVRHNSDSVDQQSYLNRAEPSIYQSLPRCRKA